MASFYVIKGTTIVGVIDGQNAAHAAKRAFNGGMHGHKSIGLQEREHGGMVGFTGKLGPVVNFKNPNA
jgi:hypothetical protein